MQFSVWPSYDRSWSETLALATWAEQSGFQSFWYADHLTSQVEDGESGAAHECWTVLAGIGAVVPRLRLVSMVSPVTISLPLKLFLFVAVDGWSRLIHGLILTYV